MLRNRWFILIGAIVVVGLLGWAWHRSAVKSEGVNLIDLLPQAQKRSAPMPPAEAIKIVTGTVNGESKACIFAHANARILFHLTPAADTWFHGFIAIDPSAWTKEGDGVVFRLGVGDGKGAYEELLNQYVNPVANQADRRWIPVSVDLSAYAGQSVYLILNTNASLPRKGDDSRNDLALWGAPTLVAGR